MAYEAKTKPTETSVADFIAAVDNPTRRADARTVCALLEEVSGEPPTMWGPSIIGFGRYHYRYDSGHEGDAPRIGFSPRKAQTVLYILGGFEGQEALVARLGKVKTSVACLYVNKLADVDMAVLREIAVRSLAENRKRYPDD
ncbi:MAG: DUF1801 domain-containing protein [Alphaproteobacteria bacterium]|jgi:hypothetical protein|nr:DUF1801 domain-containing protein [Alphaproteobacteria bacterium]MBU2041956.1 DUF1801 domain-containing protein [Alphaproteobacteria bacterium]MBU2125110.1 DUF1801 domain-containing protein [Alphaproteobacteria bacterium]MBU2207198.1 DUF1801 domain-containing protein [Alphaproteobacteria bacterium]MBU2291420.1 DUF1801 domain-containing protein [Alphaproteobacteria bacterium]